MPLNNINWNEQLKDEDWIRKSFMLSEDNMTEQARHFRAFNTASTSYTTSRLGFNWAINPAPQRTRHADIKYGGDAEAKKRLVAMINRSTKKVDTSKKDFIDNNKSSGTAILGSGRWWKEAIDDNSQYVHMSFGVPEFQGLVSFFTGFYSQGMGALANEGREGGLFYGAGKVLGLVVILPYWRLLALGRIANWVVNGGSPPTSYYSMKRTMHLYWKRADFIANNIAVNMGIVPRTLPPLVAADLSKATQSSDVDESYSAWFKKHAPDIFRSNGTVDLFLIASRAQRLANQRYKALEDATGKSNNLDTAKANLARYIENWELPNDSGAVSIDKGLEQYFKIAGNSGDASTKAISDKLQTKAAEAKSTATSQQDTTSVVGAEADEAGKLLLTPQDTLYAAGAEYDKEAGVWKTIKGWITNSESLELIEAEHTQGSAYVTFKVDFNGEISESFSNSTGSPAIKEKVNGMSRSARSARFDFSDGKLGVGGLDQAIGAVQDFASGVLDGVGLSGLISLAGSAYTDFPDTWQDSAASWPSQSYTMKLRPWAGNKMSQYLYMYIPLSLLLAAALPLSTGPQSYTSPFICEFWSRGRNQSRLAIIDSLEIRRGTGNLGWNNENEALGIDITFSIKDLSTIMHAPISSFADTGGLFNPISTIFPNDSRFQDYLAVLGNLSIADQTQTARRLALNMTRYGAAWDSYWTKSRFYNWYGSTWMAGLASNLYRDSERTVSY